MYNERGEGMIPFHPVSEIFPMMQDAELRDLAADIEEHGLIEAIWTYRGQIIDGRNRYRACLIAGEEPRFQEYSGDESGLVNFVLGLNLKRRHLDASQRAVIGLAIEKYYHDIARKNMSAGGSIKHNEQGSQKIDNLAIVHAASEAAKQVGVNRQYIHDAKRIEAQAPDLIPQIASGAMNIPQAKREVDKRQRATDAAVAIAMVTEEARRDLSEVCNIRHCSMRELLTSGIHPDCIITDPPYQREYLPLWPRPQQYRPRRYQAMRRPSMTHP